MSSYREIVTKAIIGKAKKNINSSFEVSPEQVPNTVLGCWVINHEFNGSISNKEALVNGSYDINIWYSYDNDTKTAVSTKRVSYQDKIKVNANGSDKIDNNSEIIVRSLKQPSVVEVNIENGLVKLKTENEMGVEIVGNAKVKVNVEDDFDEYEEVLDDDIDNINEDYLEQK